MKNFLKKIRTRKVLISLAGAVTALLALAPLLATPSLSALSEAQKNPYAELSLKEGRALYHLRVNDLFNRKIRLLLANKGAEKGDCSDQNDITTYCLGEEGLNEYHLYRDALKIKQEEPFDRGAVSGKALIGRYVKGNIDDFMAKLKEEELNYNSQSEILRIHEANLATISQEMKDAKNALDKTLSAYNELRGAYPLHLEFEEMLKTLQKYRDYLKALRVQVETFPGKFHDASTTKCQ